MVAEEASPAQQAAASSDLVAAVAFDVDGSALLVDVPTTGSFPNSFRLGALPPPPAAALVRSDAIASTFGQAGFLIAKITAVPRNHAATLRPNIASVGWSCGPEVAAGCTHSGKVCSPDASQCAQVEAKCTFENKDCRLTKIEGSAELLAKRLHLFSGTVREYALLYVSADAPKDSLASQMYARSQPLSAGYHLVERRETTELQRLTSAECTLRATMSVIADYSKEMGRTFQDDGELLDTLLVNAFNAKYGTKHAKVEDIDVTSPEFSTVAPEVLKQFEVRLVGHELRRHCFEIEAPYNVVGASGAVDLKLSLTPEVPRVGDVYPDGPPWSPNGGRVTLDWSRKLRD